MFHGSKIRFYVLFPVEKNQKTWSHSKPFTKKFTSGNETEISLRLKIIALRSQKQISLAKSNNGPYAVNRQKQANGAKKNIRAQKEEDLKSKMCRYFITFHQTRILVSGSFDQFTKLEGKPTTKDLMHSEFYNMLLKVE